MTQKDILGSRSPKESFWPFLGPENELSEDFRFSRCVLVAQIACFYQVLTQLPEASLE